MSPEALCEPAFSDTSFERLATVAANTANIFRGPLLVVGTR